MLELSTTSFGTLFKINFFLFIRKLAQWLIELLRLLYRSLFSYFFDWLLLESKIVCLFNFLRNIFNVLSWHFIYWWIFSNRIHVIIWFNGAIIIFACFFVLKWVILLISWKFNILLIDNRNWLYFLLIFVLIMIFLWILLFPDLIFLINILLWFLFYLFILTNQVIFMFLIIILDLLKFYLLDILIIQNIEHILHW